jgi:hypothetical protein
VTSSKKDVEFLALFMVGEMLAMSKVCLKANIAVSTRFFELPDRQLLLVTKGREK